MSKKLVLATSNPGKLAELQPLLADVGYALVTQGELGVADAVEDGLSFVENAILKARHACAATGLPALADDSGLVVDALDGEPGLYSARYAGTHGDSAANIARLLERMQGLEGEQRRAHFHCVIVLMRHARDPQPIVAEGRWPGLVLEAPRGRGGFGYDPVFLVPEQQHTAAELDPALKNRISHRGLALAALRARLHDL
ncbi:MAG TPA: RdgB/HAM1 family non-canonical purine NTP pyrophosphatase [Arenimonas sp.]|uniref:RdgB/HAM1 family non-canonical purine NTP pyrophosphatase n=1 Tax=Arenimonas sp. TaxID=1872635 RepID=UPI002D7F29D0|nr:RdgB/HAM1 family non-canonical purine NTP pyrophosphatase [Arenimonas sp.]HEU0154245.1 RdgB/HAM1 family non-canonical purine NTP pyrophosphatase [Arenimonas sp.]